jgi:alkanesulfonate monooxygenase SsuD/methylene tetrahydromethanopterin reductase-like flavin-dependent oxidoreductase (luciferase family)
VATLDVLSGGRFLFGVGAGWLEGELRNHGVDPSRRWQRTTEAVLAMKAIWTEEAASFAGEFVRFELVRQGPRPAQKPHPPILVGANGPRAFERVLEWGDEWHPGAEPRIEQRVAELRRIARERGRERIRVSVFAAPQDDEAVERYRAAGIDGCVFAIETGPREELETKLRSLSELARRHR